MIITSTAIATSFLITLGGNELISDSIIKDSSNTYIEKSYINKSISFLDEKYEKLYTELYSYKELNDNWDGYGGRKPSDEIINTVKSFIDILKNNQINNPKIMVSGDGEIALFWKNNKNYIEISFDISEHLTFFYELNKKVYGEEDIKINGNIPSKLLFSFNYIKNQISTKNSDISLTNRDNKPYTTFLI